MIGSKGKSLGLVILASAATLASAAQWEPVAQQPAGGCGRDVSIATAGSETDVYACVDPAGVDGTPRIYRSTNLGSSWNSVFAYAHVNAVRAVSTDNSVTVYAGVYEEGIYKSTDRGETWYQRNSGMDPVSITAIEFAGSNPSFVYAAGSSTAATGGGKAYRTTDAGESWVDVTPDFLHPHQTYIAGLAVHPTEPDFALLCTYFSPPDSAGGIYLTTDGGESWSQPYAGEAVHSLAISRSNPLVAYAGGNDGILKSTDGGQNWSVLPSSPGRVQSLVIAPDDDGEVYATSDGICYTSNGGQTWEQRATGMWLKSTSRACIDNNNPDTLFVGESAAGVYRTFNGGGSWQQVSTWSPYRDIRKLITDEHDGYCWTYDDKTVVDVSPDGGGSWTSVLVCGEADHVEDMTHPGADVVLVVRPTGIPQLDANGFLILRSTDRGYSWGVAYSSSEGNDEFYQFGAAGSDPERVYGATKIGSCPRILKSTDCGETWTQPENSHNSYTYNAVAVSPDDPDVVYFGCRDGRVVKSEDGGETVEFLGALPSLVEIRRLVIGVGGLVMYAATPNGVYRSEYPWATWEAKTTGMTWREVADLVMDPNGSALWAAVDGPIAGPFVYVSYDGAESWSLENGGLPIAAVVHSLSFDRDRYLHAGTSVGVFTYGERPGPQIGPDATYPNWGRKLARDPETGNLHVVYTATDVVYYKQSTNDGATWSVPEPIGEGKYPAIALNGLIDGYGLLYPWVVYLTPGGSIVRAIRGVDGAWTSAVVFQSSPDDSAGAPSIYADVIAGPYATSYVTYPVHVGDSPTLNYIYFNAVTQVGVSQPEIVDGPQEEYCYGASVVVNPAASVHVCWIRGERVIYRERSPLYGWSDTLRISSADTSQLLITEPASNPSMEAWGDHVYCVWHGPNLQGGLPGDIWQRDRWLTQQDWYVPMNM